MSDLLSLPHTNANIHTHTHTNRRKWYIYYTNKDFYSCKHCWGLKINRVKLTVRSRNCNMRSKMSRSDARVWYKKWFISSWWLSIKMGAVDERVVETYTDITASTHFTSTQLHNMFIYSLFPQTLQQMLNVEAMQTEALQQESNLSKLTHGCLLDIFPSYSTLSASKHPQTSSSHGRFRKGQFACVVIK